MTSATSIAERAPDATAPTVTKDQMELITRTVAQGATPDELKLYLFDCARQGVHPLDKLIHFTKRSGKYTPVTSIDFMRIRAAESGEYAGSDDAVFTLGDERIHAPHTATVTVWRLVQGTRCQFTATARWDEYKPEQNDFMWRKMPHTMLAKCAEALALRKGFPRQLAGLYAKEEMDQADSPRGSVVEAQNDRVVKRVDATATEGAVAGDSSRGITATTSVSSAPPIDETPRAGSSPAPVTDHGPDLGADLPPGYYYIKEYRFDRGWHEILILGFDAKGGAMKLSTKLPIGNIAKQAWQEHRPVRVAWSPKPKGNKDEGYLNDVSALPVSLPEIQIQQGDMTAGEVRFD